MALNTPKPLNAKPQPSTLNTKPLTVANPIGGFSVASPCMLNSRLMRDRPTRKLSSKAWKLGSGFLVTVGLKDDAVQVSASADALARGV